jgi:chemosensory pili system protein ChpA (sensor histidine kinase/response regulator)
LKRLQQENTQLKKKLGDLGASLESTTTTIPASPKEEPTERKILAAVPDLERKEPTPEPAAEGPKHALDPDAIESLLNGTPATPPETLAEPEAPTPLEAVAPEPTTPSDQFEKLVDSVETSLEIPAPAPVEPAPIAAAPKPAPAPEMTAAPGPATDAGLANKTDEELLKEFENLLNS